MKSLMVRTILVIASITVTAILFQNCSQSFKIDDGDAAGTSNLGSSANHDTPHITAVSTKMEPNIDMEFSVFADALLPSTSYEWSHTLNGTPSACTLKNGNKATTYIINCAQAGSLVVKTNALEGNTPITIAPYTLTLMASPGPGTPTNEINLQVNFSIPAGTGATPWNTTATAVETFVGQTLKFTNDDAVDHQLHTGGKPCPHGSAMSPGASTNCVISTAYDYKTDGSLYDHNLGTKSPFFMVAYDGSALYTANCASCHGALASSARKGARVSQIKNALSTVPQMSTNTNLMKLTQRQIEAISFALGGK